jgi:broad specificity polyphosphatase/5'/3'-nucleotidase SurE
MTTPTPPVARVTHDEAERIAEDWINERKRQYGDALTEKTDTEPEAVMRRYFREQKAAEAAKKSDVEVVRASHVPCTVRHADCGNCRATEALSRLSGEGGG